METNNKTGLAKDLREKSFVWFGKCAEKNKFLLVEYIDKNSYIFAGVSVESKKIVIEGPKSSTVFTADLVEILTEINPKYAKLVPGSFEYPELPEEYKTIVGDFNEEMLENKIKVLNEKEITKALTDNGFDISGYKYFKVVADNTHNLKPQEVLKGYNKYPKELLSYMKDVSKYKDYVVSQQDIFDMLDSGCYKGIVAAGPAGTGKTTDFFADSAKKEIPVIDFQCVHNTEADDLLGKFIPKTDGGFEFQYGPLSLAVKYDCRFSCQEWNYAPSAVQSMVNSLMDDNGTMTLPNGEVLNVGPNFRMFLTVNPGYRGTNLFNEATLNRFVTVYYEPISKETLIERLSFETGYKNIQVLEALAEQFDKLRDLYKNHNMETETTYRNASRFLRMLLLHPEIDIEKQFDMAFISNAIFEMDDIDSELKEWKTMCSPMIESIKAAIKLSTGVEEDPTPVKLEAHLGLDDLDEQMNAFTEEEGVELPDEEV